MIVIFHKKILSASQKSVDGIPTAGFDIQLIPLYYGGGKKENIEQLP